MSGEIRTLFISHAPRDGETFQGLQALCKKQRYGIEGGPPPSGTSSTARIDAADALVVVISPATRTRAEVNEEIEYAHRQGKRIVGVYAPDGTESDVPASFQKYGPALVTCQAEQVLAALVGDINHWFTPDGDAVSEREIDRFTCGEEEPS